MSRDNVIIKSSDGGKTSRPYISDSGHISFQFGSSQTPDSCHCQRERVISNYNSCNHAFAHMETTNYTITVNRYDHGVVNNLAVDPQFLGHGSTPESKLQKNTRFTHKAIHEIFNLRIFLNHLYIIIINIHHYHHIMLSLGYDPPPPPPRKLKHLINSIMDTLINFDYPRKSDEFSDPSDQCGNPYAK